MWVQLAMVAALAWSQGGPGEPESQPFRLHREHVILVRGAVGSVDDLVFLLDTGSGRTVLTTDVTAALKLHGTPTELHFFGRRASADDVVIPNLAAGGFRTGSHHVLTTDLSAAATALGLTRLDGIIGMDVLRRRSFGLDFANRFIRFGLPPTLRYRVELADHPFLLVVDGQVDRRRVRLSVDTGASHLVLFGAEVAGQPGVAVDLAGGTRVAVNRVQTLRIGNWLSQRVTALQASAESGLRTGTDGVLGLPALGASYVQFDFERRAIAWNP